MKLKAELTPDGSKKGFLIAWQWLELGVMVSYFLLTFIMYAFSGNKDIAFSYSILWKVFVLKAVVLLFFYRKKLWAVIFNLVQNAAILLFWAFAVFYTLFAGNFNSFKAFVSGIFFLGLIAMFGWLYIFILKTLWRYFLWLKSQKSE